MNTKPLLCNSKSPGPAIWIACLLLPLAMGAVLAGCMSRPALVRQTYALNVSPPTKSIEPKGQTVLAISKVEINPLFEGRSFVYRTGPDRYQVDPYASFLVSPSRALAMPIRTYLRNSGAFKDVVEPGSQLHADTFLEVYVTELYGDIRKSDQPAAVLTMRILEFKAESSQTNQPLFTKNYMKRVPLQKKTAADLVAGWNLALAQIMAELSSDLAATGGE